MAKKAKEEKSLEQTIWDSADKLRGAVEPSEYKHVVLSLIFLKYANDKFAEQRKKMIEKGQSQFLEMMPFYVKDNVLYSKNYENEKYPNIEKVSGNYEGEKVIRIYNERILKTDKGFYEIMSYFNTKENKTVTTTVKINMLTKYYDEVLTFTYKYVILKDLTIIPINDIMENRVRDYSYDYFLSTFNYESEIRYEE